MSAGNVVMSRDEDHGPDAASGEGREAEIQGDEARPVELVRRARRPDLAVKIAKGSKALEEGGRRAGPPPPGIITVGGVDEAKAYVPAMPLAVGAKPAAADSQRVRIADPRRAQTVQLNQRDIDAARRRADQVEQELEGIGAL